MANIFKYHDVSESDFASPRQGALSLLRGDWESWDESVQPAHNYDETIQRQINDALEDLRHEMQIKSKDSRQDEINQELDRTIEELSKKVETIQAQLDIKVLAQDEREERLGKIDSKLDKFIRFFKRESDETNARFELDRLEREKIKEEGLRLREETAKLSKKLIELREDASKANTELIQRLEKIEGGQNQRKGDLVELCRQYLLSWIGIYVNGSEYEGVLVEVTCKYLVLISSGDLLVIPLTKIDSINLSTK